MESRIRTLGRLFWAFFKIALFVVGGGYAILAVADRVFSRMGWTREGELVAQLPVLQSVPGLIAGNTAIYVGHKKAGIAGAAVGLVAVALPSFVIFLLVTCALVRVPLDSGAAQAVLLGARAAMTGILIGTTWKAWKKSEKTAYAHVLLFAATVALLVFRVSPALVVLGAMLLGLAPLLYGRFFCSAGLIVPLFLTYGFLCFGGGFVLVPLYLNDFVGPDAPYLQISEEAFSRVIALTQMTPGPVSVNAATYFGYHLGGVAGAAAATACLLLPSFFLLVWALRSLEKGRRNPFVQGILRGAAPASTALLIAATYAFAKMCMGEALGFALAVLSAGLFLFTRLSPTLLIVFVSAGALAALRIA